MIGYTSQEGQSSIFRKVNQDSFLIKKCLSGCNDVWLIAVADGHGANGHLVSKLIK